VVVGNIEPLKTGEAANFLGDRSNKIIFVKSEPGDRCGIFETLILVTRDAIPIAFRTPGPEPVVVILPVVAIGTLIESDQCLPLIERNAALGYSLGGGYRAGFFG
jgi:hypothetical protein